MSSNPAIALSPGTASWHVVGAKYRCGSLLPSCEDLAHGTRARFFRIPAVRHYVGTKSGSPHAGGVTQRSLPARPDFGEDHGDATVSALYQVSRHGCRCFGVINIDAVDRQIAACLVLALQTHDRNALSGEGRQLRNGEMKESAYHA